MLIKPQTLQSDTPPSSFSVVRTSIPIRPQAFQIISISFQKGGTIGRRSLGLTSPSTVVLASVLDNNLHLQRWPIQWSGYCRRSKDWSPGRETFQCFAAISFCNQRRVYTSRSSKADSSEAKSCYTAATVLSDNATLIPTLGKQPRISCRPLTQPPS